ncbi:GNAT family N-acetyltransferase [Actinotalea sp. BY-33]|uniref:GNAT family N-acetyltransferase n=1 Tax=Actinotalea soli TaxID=2819234 RepID=A0A939LQN7_9CELL|nr:GNAT family N-acetyltransferase [Actinotalea soli]MBO1752043.1 GNAT family N-acetyltransferase [Actinotalea soli]
MPDSPLLVRPSTPADAPFLAVLHDAVRGEEVATFGWPPDVAEAFLAQQRVLRDAQYAAAYPHAQQVLAEVDGAPVARLLVDARTTHRHIVDLAVLPAHQGRGIGTVLLHGVLEQAAAEGVPVRLTVRADNAGARRLYARLGFAVVRDDGLDLALEASTDQEVARGRTVHW